MVVRKTPSYDSAANSGERRGWTKIEFFVHNIHFLTSGFVVKYRQAATHLCESIIGALSEKHAV